MQFSGGWKKRWEIEGEKGLDRSRETGEGLFIGGEAISD